MIFVFLLSFLLALIPPIHSILVNPVSPATLTQLAGPVANVFAIHLFDSLGKVVHITET